MSRLIDADAVIDALNKIFPADPMRNDYTQGITCGVALATEYIKQLPSAQPEQRWISCSERLPKAFEHCLWTTTDGKVVYHYCDGQFSKYIAWMPLPCPYQPERRQ